MNYKALLVCEGPSDYPIIEGVIKHTASQVGINLRVELIAPQYDATSGQYPPHGWTAVKKWCEHYSPNKYIDPTLPENIKEVIRRKNWETLLIQSNADFLFIHIDTDIAAEIGKRKNFINKTQRKNYCKKNIDNWLGIKKTNNSLQYILPTFCTETWILATYDESNSSGVFNNTPIDYEEIPNVEDLLLSMGYKKKIVNGRQRLFKNKKLYTENQLYAKRLLDNIAVASSRCEELNSLQSFILNILQ